MQNGEPLYKRYYDFRWEIQHPFLPFLRSEATFYNGRWKAAIQPISMTLTNREFDFSLEYISRHSLPVNRLSLLIKLNENVVLNHKTWGVNLGPWNRSRFSIRCPDCEIRNQATIPHFVIEVGIYIRRGEPEVESGADRFQLSLLAIDMELLFKEALYSDYNLIAHLDYPITSNVLINVHSYILRQRWSTLFDGPEYRPRDDHCVLHMSAAVLTDILRYVYTGNLDVHVLNERGVAHFNELCVMIDKYELNDLRRSLYLKEFIEVRIDEKTSLTKSIVIPLYISDDEPMENNFTEVARLDNENILFLKVKVRNYHAAGSWLSYSIRSNAHRTFYVHVVFMFEEYLIGCSTRTINRPVCSDTQKIFPNAIFVSAPILDLSCPDLFPELNPSRRDRRHRITVIWHVTDGTTSSRFEMDEGFEVDDDDNDARVAFGEDMCRLYTDNSRTNKRDFFLVTTCSNFTKVFLQSECLNGRTYSWIAEI